MAEGFQIPPPFPGGGVIDARDTMIPLNSVRSGHECARQTDHTPENCTGIGGKLAVRERFLPKLFYARQQNALRVFAIVWASVCLSVCLSHS